MTTPRGASLFVLENEPCFGSRLGRLRKRLPGRKRPAERTSPAPRRQPRRGPGSSRHGDSGHADAEAPLRKPAPGRVLPMTGGPRLPPLPPTRTLRMPGGVLRLGEAGGRGASTHTGLARPWTWLSAPGRLPCPAHPGLNPRPRHPPPLRGCPQPPPRAALPLSASPDLWWPWKGRLEGQGWGGPF